MFENLVQTVATGGYPAIFLLMLLENIFPPIPSEAIMPLAGFAAARGDLNFVGVILAGTLGSIVGAVPWYLAGRWYGRKRLKAFAGRHGRWLTVSPNDLHNAAEWFERHGYASVFFGRLIPTIRTLISVPAGLVCMPILPFLLISAAGSLIWTSILTLAGYLLESQYTRVADWLDPVTYVIIGGIVLFYLYRVVTYER